MDTSAVDVTEVDTPHGPARVHLRRPDRTPTGLLMLGHGAGGGVTAGDLQAAATVALAAGMAAALIEQPYRVAGRKAPAPAAHVDTAWLAVAGHLHGHGAEFAGLPLVTGGRSFGARVACRTATATGSAGVLCLAFPLHPPGRPEKSRQAELSGVTAPTLVIQGERDPFGRPEGSATCRIVVVAGDHSLKKDLPLIRETIGGWLPEVLARG
jgi:predicted alpha/beta-hydrolase family hydrolase